MPRCLILLFLLVSVVVMAQPKESVQLLHVQDSVSFRGLSVPADDVLWVSGSRGTVGRSLDGGKTWQWQQVPGYEKRDFRDIEAFDAQTAIIMAIAEPAHLLKTTDGGATWKVVFADSTPGMFLDAMHFRDRRNGIVAGDPVNGIFFIRGTNDGGETWTVTYPTLRAREGEACFAASGTNILLMNDGRFHLVTGGKISRLLSEKSAGTLPLVQGKESTGANSIAIWQGKQIAVAGGDFAVDKSATNNCVISPDGGETWKRPSQAPGGYRSCVAFLDKTTLISCGPSGVDISSDSGGTWQLISPESYHVCQPAKNGKTIYLAGSGGKVAKLITGK